MKLALKKLPSQKNLRLVGAFLILSFITVYYTGVLMRTPGPRHYQEISVRPPNKTSPPTIKEHYLVWNDKCQIQEVDPFDKSIKHLLRAPEKVVCSRLAPLTYTTRASGGPVLKVDEGVVTQYKTTLSRLRCCYSVFTRASENTNNVTSCKKLDKEQVLKPDEEFLLVRCNDTKTKKNVYLNMHAVVHVKPKVSVPTSSNDSPRLSVLMLGIDSMSRSNMLRTMPRTVGYLQTNKWLEFRGYNKIADNTYPNLMAVLTGLDKDQLTHLNCWASKKQDIDHCPIIWKQFKDKGYVTAYAEDEPDMATFNYHKIGFLAPPTDYYFRPFMLAATRKLPVKKRDGCKACLGPTSTTEHFLRLTLDLATTFNEQLYFAVIWLNNFSHNNHNTPAAFDQRFFDFFHELSETGALNSTLVVFFSDHGTRFGKIRKTLVGWLEDRLPFMYLWLPQWFSKLYPTQYSNLKDNGYRLTSPYDLHLTLKDVLAGLDQVTPGNGTSSCPTCASLFTPIPNVRGCMDAGITSHWCTCGTQANILINEDIVKNATMFVVNEIQTKLEQARNATEKCAKLKLNKIIDARCKVDSEKSKLFDDYIVVFETKPGLGQYDATVRHWHKTKPPKFDVLGTISRVNSYESQSACVKNFELKLYCVCVHS